MGELRRILDKGNSKFIDEVKKRCEDFCTKVQFYGVWKKVMRPPMTLDVGKSFCCVSNSLCNCPSDMGVNRMVYVADM